LVPLQVKCGDFVWKCTCRDVLASLLWEPDLTVPAHLNAVQLKDSVTGSMPNPFNIEKKRAGQEKREKKKAEREELVWEPIIDGYPSDGKTPTEGLQGARARWAVRTNHAVMHDDAAVTQVHLFTPVHRKHA
jgi:hypothetical protein